MDFGREVSFGRVGIRGLGVGISPVVGGRSPSIESIGGRTTSR